MESWVWYRASGPYTRTSSFTHARGYFSALAFVHLRILSYIHAYSHTSAHIVVDFYHRYHWFSLDCFDFHWFLVIFIDRIWLLSILLTFSVLRRVWGIKHWRLWYEIVSHLSHPETRDTLDFSLMRVIACICWRLLTWVPAVFWWFFIELLLISTILSEIIENQSNQVGRTRHWPTRPWLPLRFFPTMLRRAKVGKDIPWVSWWYGDSREKFHRLSRAHNASMFT